MTLFTESRCSLLGLRLYSDSLLTAHAASGRVMIMANIVLTLPSAGILEFSLLMLVEDSL